MAGLKKETVLKIIEHLAKELAQGEAERKVHEEVRRWHEQWERELREKDPIYQEQLRQWRENLRRVAEERRRQLAEEAAKRAEDEHFREMMQDPDLARDLVEDAERRKAERDDRERQEEERQRREGTNPPNDSKKKFDESEQDRAPEKKVDPLVIDLDNDGIETTDLSHGAFFDHNKNGLAELSSWVSNDDGLLVMDRNGDVIINDGGELFGDQTVLKSGLKASNGFEALAELDTNSDGKINSQDEQFGRLRVWKDSNGDGYSSPEELHSLEEVGVESINLQSVVVKTIDAQLNTPQRVGTFEKVDGSTGQIAEYGFYQETTYTLANEWPVVPQEVNAMPMLWGYGNVYDVKRGQVCSWLMWSCRLMASTRLFSLLSARISCSRRETALLTLL